MSTSAAAPPPAADKVAAAESAVAESDPQVLVLTAYAKSVAAAYEQWAAGESAAARARLAELAPELRGWEWHYVNRLCTAELAPPAGGAGAEMKRNALVLTGHKNSVDTALFGPQGAWVVTTSADHTLRIWDSETGAQLKSAEPTGWNLCHASLSADGKKLLTTNHPYVRVWDTQTGEQLVDLTRQVGMESQWPIHFAGAISPDGKRVVTCSPKFKIKLRDSQTGAEIVTLQGIHTYWAHSAAFSADGRLLVTASEADDAARVWDVKTGKELWQLKGHGRQGVWSVAFDPQGAQVATGAGEGPLRLWNITDGQLVQTIPAHTRPLTAIAWTPDRSRIVTGSQDHTVKIWDPATGSHLFTLPGHTDIVNSVAFNRDGNRLITGSWDKTARIWDARPLPMANAAPQKAE
ncbi:MAG: WD40 repeat domain-containing protein [Planctomycetes bacterium]|nr:WD40 repeat domain-containing protein [Planctomycetota bacterium]